MKRFAALLTVFFVLMCAMPMAMAKKVPHPDKPKLIFVPHDNRPISDEQTEETMKAIGWDIVTTPEELLGNRDNLGNPDDVWDCLMNRRLRQMLPYCLRIRSCTEVLWARESMIIHSM